MWVAGLSAEMPRHSYTALALGSALAALILFWFVGGARRNPFSVASGSPFLWISSLTRCFSLAASASSARAVGGVGAARAMVGRAVLSVKPCLVEAAASVSHLQSPMECSSIPAGSVMCSPDPPKPDLSPQFPGCKALVRSVWPGDHP